MCDSKSHEKISGQELTLFLEAVTDLKGGDIAVESNANKAIVKKVMELCKKGNDEKITKEEFIAW